MGANLQFASDTSINIGFVMEGNSRSNTSFLKAYIPILMSSIDMGDTLMETPEVVSAKMIKNSNFAITKEPTTQYLTKNYINLQSNTQTGQDSKLYNKGDKISVEFVNGDLSKGRFSPYISNTEDLSTNAYDTYSRQYVETYQYDIPINNTRGAVTAGSPTGKKVQYDVLMDAERGFLGLRLGTVNSEEYNVHPTEEPIESIILDSNVQEVTIRTPSSKFIVGNLDVTFTCGNFTTSFSSLLSEISSLKRRVKALEDKEGGE